MKILVTGGAGFIGSHTVVALAEAGYEPIIVDNFSNSLESALAGINALVGREIPCHRVDCTDAAGLDQVFAEVGEVAGVIHFAAAKAVGESVQNPLKYYHNNVAGLTTLLAAMLRANCTRLVFSSSCTVYGIPDQLPVSEDSPTHRANSPYGNTKQICEDLLTDMAASGHSPIHAISLRYFNPIGAHSSARIGELPLDVPNNLVPFVTQTAAGLRPQLTVHGTDYDTPDGSCIRDYIHVVDLADAHVLAVRRLIGGGDSAPALEVFNLGTGQGATVLEVVNTFQQVTGVAVPYVKGARRPGDVPAIYGEVSRAAEVLGFRTKRSLADALADAWRWQQSLAR